MATSVKHRESPAWKLVVFHNKQRKEFLVVDPKKGLQKVKQLAERGVKAHLVSRRKAYWPKLNTSVEKHTAKQALADGMLWCPYCRRWRWFTIPKYRPNAEFGSIHWILNSYVNQELRCCSWCLISVDNFYVKQINGEEVALGRRSRARRRRRVVRH